MNKYKYIWLWNSMLAFLSCNKDVLDRPPLTSYVDMRQYWRNEDDIACLPMDFIRIILTAITLHLE